MPASVATIVPRVTDVFHVKICGVTDPDDARRVADAGADAIGINFVAGSPRRLEPLAAGRVVDAIPRHVVKVGVFAGADPDDMLRIARELGLDAIQLHGHLFGPAAAVDPPESCAALAGLPVIRAVRLEAGGLDSARRWFAAARGLGSAPRVALVDAGGAPGSAAAGLGGTGERVDWHALARAESIGVPLALAGGLHPGNVAEAIRITGVGAVDTASGVERSPGSKDPEKVRAFVAAARRALGL